MLSIMTELEMLSLKTNRGNPVKKEMKAVLQPNSTDIFVYLTSSYKNGYIFAALQDPPIKKKIIDNRLFVLL